MSNIETAAIPYLAPMIQGNECALDEHAQRVVATWSFKTVMMLNLADAHPRDLGEQYSYLYAFKRPTPWHLIWLTAYATPQPGLSFVEHAWHTPIPPGDGSAVGLSAQAHGFTDGSYSYLMTIEVGQLVAQVFWTESQAIYDRITASPSNRYLTRVWPTSVNPAYWPVGHIEDEDTLETFRRRFFRQGFGARLSDILP